MAQNRLIPTLILIVIVWYIAATFVPQAVDSCLDAQCSFSAGATVISIAIPVVLAALTVALEMALFKKGLAQAIRDFGFTRVNRQALLIAVVYLIPLIAYYPVYSLLTGTPIALQTHWPWLALGALLNNGLNEEVMMRGFVFRHLREGRTFWRAAVLATTFFAIYHVPLIVLQGPAIGIVGILTAIPTGLLTAYVYERGGQSLWPAMLVHAGTNLVPFVVATTTEAQPIAAGLYLLVSIAVGSVIVAWAYKRGFERQPAAQAVARPA